MFDKIFDESADKLRIFGAYRVGRPAEYLCLIFCAVNVSRNFRRVCRTPLTEQVRNFKIFDAAAFAHLNPAVKVCVFKRVVVAVFINIDKSDIGTLPAFARVKRRRQNGGKNHIHALGDRFADKVFDYLPMAFAVNVAVVIRCKAVVVEPVCVNELLLRKHCVHDFHRHFRSAEEIAVLVKLKRDGICSGCYAVRFFDKNVKRTQAGRENSVKTRGSGHEQVGIKPRGLAQIVVVRFVVTRLVIRNFFNRIKRYVIFKGRIYHEFRRYFSVEFGCLFDICHLKSQTLIFQHLKRVFLFL